MKLSFACALQANCWDSRLLASPDVRTLLTTLIFILNCIHGSRKRTYVSCGIASCLVSLPLSGNYLPKQPSAREYAWRCWTTCCDCSRRRKRVKEGKLSTLGETFYPLTLTFSLYLIASLLQLRNLHPSHRRRHRPRPVQEIHNASSILLSCFDRRTAHVDADQMKSLRHTKPPSSN